MVKKLNLVVISGDGKNGIGRATGPCGVGGKHHKTVLLIFWHFLPGDQHILVR